MGGGEVGVGVGGEVGVGVGVGEWGKWVVGADGEPKAD